MNRQRRIEVWAHWTPLDAPIFVGTLFAAPSRGKEIFSFEYSGDWLKNPIAQSLDPSLGLYKGLQYAPHEKENFGAFLDSSPDRWGRALMRRREALSAREEGRKERILRESDYLLGVYDAQRLGGLRFRETPEGPFLDDRKERASPPWASLRELEKACLELEKKGAETKRNYAKWLRLLIAPGGSLGGARPKAGVVDEKGSLWIAKFPSANDEWDVGAWENVVHRLAASAGIQVPEAQSRAFNGRHRTFLAKRFDRIARRGGNDRVHFASAMTLLQRSEGDDASTGASYLELAEFLGRFGAEPNRDLEQLWRRIVFFMCVSNTDDHLRNHGFLLQSNGWRLSPAYDMNPVAASDGLRLNVSETDNAQNLELAREVSPYFRLKESSASQIIKDVVLSVKAWRETAKALRIPTADIERMAPAFRVADNCG